jgi:uncharacterized protein (UPF0303 family)
MIAAAAVVIWLRMMFVEQTSSSKEIVLEFFGNSFCLGPNVCLQSIRDDHLQIQYHSTANLYHGGTCCLSFKGQKIYCLQTVVAQPDSSDHLLMIVDTANSNGIQWEKLY